MIGLFLFGASLVISWILLQKVKAAGRRKWLGIGLGVTGLIGVLATPTNFDGFDPFASYLVMWFTGMTLFFNRNRYSSAAT
ncbi:hypothetical protein [Pseudomonas viridiflava]|uniref:hypothetical protein n=1 Tax=Pseudomonas viridiflava TaxID=33069 RepID=UPI000F0191F8|nr:hypothetical protein [Pseudomonas viridiflava]QXG25879.1 hypothetical protein KTT56_03200 [Pseudomonas viridiflava]